MNWDEVYENWNDYSYGRKGMLFSLDGFGESVWVKEVDKGLVGIDNNPLSELFRWQDIVRYVDDDDRGWDSRQNPLLVHRRWNSLVLFRFDEPGIGNGELLVKSEEAKETRSKILEALKELGSVSFWVSGVGQVLMKTKNEDEAERQVLELGKTLGVELRIYEEE